MKVLLTVPTSPSSPYIHKHCVFAIVRLLQDKRHDVKLMLPSHKPFENNLHLILNDFMDGDYDFWLSFDSDNPPIRNPLDLIDLNKDIIGIPTPVWHYDRNDKPKDRPIYLNGYKYVPEKDAYTEWPDKDGLQKVDAIGTGCFLIARRVFENPEMRKAPFQRTFNEDGTVNKGNDIAFSERARANGFNIFMHYDYMCMHFVEVELNETMEAFGNFMKGLYGNKHPVDGKH